MGFQGEAFEKILGNLFFGGVKNVPPPFTQAVGIKNIISSKGILTHVQYTLAKVQKRF